MAEELRTDEVGAVPTTSPGVQMPITVFAPADNAPTVNTGNVGNEINFISDNSENFLSDDSEYYTTNSSGGLVYHDANARTTTILNPGTGEISVYDADTQMVTVYTDDENTTGYSMHVNSSFDSGVGFSTEGTISNGKGSSFPVNSGTLQNFYTTNGVDLDAITEDYSNSFTMMNPTTSLRGPGDTFATAASALPVHEINSSGEIVGGDSPSDFKQYFDMCGYVGPYDIDNYDTYTQFYEADQKLDIFGTLSDNFSDEIDALISETGEIGTAWGDLNTDFNNILSEFDDLFSVGGLDVSVGLAPLKESYATAKEAVDSFLEAVATEYSRVSDEKKRILEERAALEKAKNKVSGVTVEIN